MTKKTRRSSKEIAAELDNFTPSFELADRLGMTRQTYEFEAADFKDYHIKASSPWTNWSAAWGNWARGWVRRGSKQISIQRADSRASVFILRREHHKQAIAWLDYYNANNPEKNLFAIKSLKRILEGWHGEYWQVPSEYPPNHGNVVQLHPHQARMKA